MQVILIILLIPCPNKHKFGFLTLKQMRLKEKHVKKYQRIYEKIYKEKIDYKEAYNQCMSLVLFCKIATKPFSKEDIRNLEKLN